ncbi:DUF3489 domain-containing protein [Sphingomonas bacterium]|uniref:DUF3489 domain-containing protein n=1 Tax=Sphingomonas bacterium TaxID=1895847 RepID=UPI00261E12A9|nr:DUF3489 domain-containing protein [Sphingomonas bacterium]MDB5679522.1 hypothetical protein [Sphingomonas bacterium]
MPKLNDTQLIILSAAVQRDNRSLHPFPHESKADAKIVGDLITRGFAEERETDDASAVSRVDGDIRFGIFATDAGLAAIGVCNDENAEVPTAAKPERQTKSAAVIALLKRDEGATLAELVAATDWLPHTTRAALTGLRKKGHAIERGKRDDDTCYRIPAVA